MDLRFCSIHQFEVSCAYPRFDSLDLKGMPYLVNTTCTVLGVLLVSFELIATIA
jgi:hypothetical protein